MYIELRKEKTHAQVKSDTHFLSRDVNWYLDDFPHLSVILTFTVPAGAVYLHGYSKHKWKSMTNSPVENCFGWTNPYF